MPPGSKRGAILALLAGFALTQCHENRVACSALDVDREARLSPASGFRLSRTDTAHAGIFGSQLAWILYSPEDRRRILSAHWCKLYGATGTGRITLYDAVRRDPIAAVDAESYETF